MASSLPEEEGAQKKKMGLLSCDFTVTISNLVSSHYLVHPKDSKEIELPKKPQRKKVNDKVCFGQDQITSDLFILLH